MASISPIAVRETADAVRFGMRCWGDFAITDAATGAALKPRGRKARALLAYLAMHPGKPVNRERLMGLLWGERGEEQARLSLRQTIFELKPFTGSAPPLLMVDRDSMTLNPALLATDIDDMRELVNDGDYEALLAALPERDDALFANLDGLDSGFDEWLAVERTRQRNALVVLISDASASALADGRGRASRALHARLLELEPDQGAPAPPVVVDVTPSVVIAPAPARRPASRAIPAAAAMLLLAGTVGGAIWLRSEPPAAAAPSRDARDLYEAAHEIVYQRKGEQFPVATQLLRRALTLEPDNAPATADLAAVLAMTNPAQGDHPEAEQLARRAIQLDPNLALGHGILGMVLGFQSKEAQAEIRRAAALDGHDPQIQFWLSNVLGIRGDYPGQLQALRRAVAADPTWHRASGAAALAASQLGYQAEADIYTARLRGADPSLWFECDYAVDWAQGRYAEVARDTLAARDRLSVADSADWKLGMALLMLGHEQPARLLLRLSPPLWRVASGAGPAPGELEPLLIKANGDDRADTFALTALRQTLQAGRAQEIVSAYDRRAGRLSLLASGDASHVSKITDGLQVALALRAVGREREAAALLDQADAAIRYSLGRGAAPNWLYAGAASVWAAQGRREEALAALQTAIDRGWNYAPMTPLPDMADIPSLAGLRGDPRFERLRRRLIDHLQSERRQLGPVPA